MSHGLVSSNARKPVVFVIEDDITVREALGVAIGSAGWEPRAIGSVGKLLATRRTEVPNCLILSVAPADLEGSEVRELLARRCDLPIILISHVADVPTVVRAVKAGAAEYLTKPLVHAVLLDAIRHALEGSRLVLAQRTQIQTLRARHEALSLREKEVMALVVAGYVNKRIGKQLGIAEITVKAHRARAMRKMDADSLPALVRMATMLSLHGPPLGSGSRGPGANRHTEVGMVVRSEVLELEDFCSDGTDIAGSRGVTLEVNAVRRDDLP